MDKNEESIFTSQFWREINEYLNNRYRYTQMQMYSHCPQEQLGIAKNQNVQISLTSWLDKTIEQSYSKLTQIIQKLKQISQEPIQNLMDEMIDQICFDHLTTGLQEAYELIKNIQQYQESQQLQIYYQEANLLSSLMHQIDWPDELSISIEQHQKQLNELTINNKIELCNLEKHTQQINLTVQYNYTSQQIGEHKLKLTRSRISNNPDELSLLKQLIISLQDYQVAESVGKATFNDYNNTITVIFDKFLSQTPVTITLEKFDNIQRLREQPYDLAAQSCSLRSDDVFEMQMCHYCKQMVEIKNLKQCQYNHYQMGLHEYNEDLLVCQRYQINTKQMQQYFLDLYSENYLIEDQQIMCQRYFCLKCLKYDFDSYEISSYLWICPLCKGLCTCLRCQRNDLIYKLKRQLLELNGDLEDIYKQSYFEILVKDKRLQLQSIPLEFLNIPQTQNEEIISQKTNRKQNQSNQIRKKIKKDGQHIVQKFHKLYQLESSSSSLKIKRSKETTQSLDSINSQVYIQ